MFIMVTMTAEVNTAVRVVRGLWAKERVHITISVLAICLLQH